jgi:hypothetical protein
MEIKKDSNSKLTIKVEKSKIMIDFDNEGNMEFYVGDNKLDKPGEYEYSHVNFRFSENKVEGFKSKINLAGIGSESNINILIAMNDLELHDSEFNMGNVNILITNVFDTKNIKNLLKKVKPEQIILLNNFIGKQITEDEAKRIKSEMNLTNIADGKLSVEESQFNTEEDMATQTYIFE